MLLIFHFPFFCSFFPGYGICIYGDCKFFIKFLHHCFSSININNTEYSLWVIYIILLEFYVVLFLGGTSSKHFYISLLRPVTSILIPTGWIITECILKNNNFCPNHFWWCYRKMRNQNGMLIITNKKIVQ